MQWKRYPTVICVLIVAAAALRTKRASFPRRSKGHKTRKHHQDEPSSVADVKAMMQSAPMDALLQKNACIILSKIGDRHREGGGHFSGKRLATSILEEGYGEVAAQGLLNILASRRDNDTFTKTAAHACWDTIAHINALQSAEQGRALFNNSPHLWEAMMGYARRFQSEFRAVKEHLYVFSGLYGTMYDANWNLDFELNEEVSKGLDKEGGLEYLLDAVDQSYTNPKLFQEATAALSDHVQISKYAANAVVGYGGVQRLTHAVRQAHHFPIEHAKRFGSRYEIMEDIVGILLNDRNRKYADAFFDAGLMEAVIQLMPDEPDDLYLQDHCCQTLNFLGKGNATVQQQLAKSAAVELVGNAASMKCAPKCYWYSVVKSWGSANVTDSTPPPSCTFLLENLKGGSNWEAWHLPLGTPNFLR